MSAPETNCSCKQQLCGGCVTSYNTQVSSFPLDHITPPPCLQISCALVWVRDNLLMIWVGRTSSGTRRGHASSELQPAPTFINHRTRDLGHWRYLCHIHLHASNCCLFNVPTPSSPADWLPALRVKNNSVFWRAFGKINSPVITV